MRKPSRAAKDDALSAQPSIDHAPQRLAERVAARGGRRRWMHCVYEHRDYGYPALAHEVEDRLDVGMRKKPAVPERVREPDVEALVQAALDQHRGELRMSRDLCRLLAVPVVGDVVPAGV